MKLFSILVATGFFLTVYAHSGSTGDNVCNSGKAQSPVDLPVKHLLDSDEIPLMRPKISSLEFVNGEGNFEMRCADKKGDCGSLWFHDKKKYALQQLHMHTPSEHTINGKRYPLELHFVHSNKAGELAVFGVLFKEGKFNRELQYILDAAENKYHTVVDLLKLSGAKLADRCVLEGSLTTPPCSEGVRWVVSTKIEEASRKQIKQYSDLVGGSDNSRPVQPLNGRNLKCFRKMENDSDNDSGSTSTGDGDSNSDSGSGSDTNTDNGSDSGSGSYSNTDNGSSSDSDSDSHGYGSSH